MSIGIKLRYFPFSELRLEPNPRPRESITDAEIDEISESILQQGIIQPPLARMRDGQPHIYAGQCRYLGFERALQRAKSGEECLVDLIEVPVLVRDIDDRTMRVHQWIENLQRKGVHPRDEVRGFAELRDVYGYTLAEISHKIGKGENYVVNRMVLLNLPDVLWKAFDEKRLTISHLEVAGSIRTSKNQEDFARIILGGRYGDKPMTVKEAQELKNADFVKPMRACGFDKADATLVPIEHKDGVRLIGGACVGCEYMAGSAKSPLCENVRCFHAKQDAAWHVVTRNAADTGRRTMDVDQTASIFDETGELLESSGFVDLGGKPLYLETGHHNEDDTPPWDELLEGTDAAALAVMARNPRTNRVHQLLEREDAIRLAVENDKKAAKIFENQPGTRKKIAQHGAGSTDQQEEWGPHEDTEPDVSPQSGSDVWTRRCEIMDALHDELMSARGVRVLTPLTWKLAVMEASRNASPVLLGHVLGLESHPRWEHAIKSDLVSEHLRQRHMTIDQAQALIILCLAGGQIIMEGTEGELVTDLQKLTPKKPVEQLYDCPVCGGRNFTKKGLKAHNCERRKATAKPVCIVSANVPGSSKSKLAKLAKNMPAGPAEITPEVKAAARKLYDAGKGKDAIAKELKISPNTVGNWQKREWPKRKATKK